MRDDTFNALVALGFYSRSSGSFTNRVKITSPSIPRMKLAKKGDSGEMFS